MFRYIKWHNNYGLELGKLYAGVKYKDKWVLLEGDEYGSALYRIECFEEVESGKNE